MNESPHPCKSHERMNIFYVSHKPSRCARWHCDKHVVKMILETTQLLYTAHWVLRETPDFSRAPYRKDMTERGYKSIRNRKHPSAIWTRESLQHYMWLCQLGKHLCLEYKHRFGSKKEHGSEKHIQWLTANPPAELKNNGWKQPPQAMPEEFQRSNSISAYRAYYLGPKRELLKYTKRNTPHWISKA